MAQKRVFAALVAGFVLLASTRFARAQEAAGAASPVEGLKTPVIEPPPEIAPPRALPPAPTLLALSQHEPQMIHEERSGLKLAGEATFWPSYSLALIASVLIWNSPGLDSEETGPCRTCKTLAVSMAIPVAGPLIVYSEISNEVSQRNPWPVLLPLGIWSAVQAAGVVMYVVGRAGHDVPQEPSVTVRHRKISVVPSMTSDGGMLAFRTPW
jgi:hypothetical protein